MAMTSAAEMEKLLGEAQAKEQAHKGIWFSVTVDGSVRRFEMWPRRLTIQQRKTIRSATGRPIESALGDLQTGEIGVDSLASLVWAATFQAEGKRLPIDALLNWVDGVEDFAGGLIEPPDELDEAEEDDDPEL